MYNPEQEELLREYKSQFPSGYNRIDQATGNIEVDQNGNPVTYKYQPPNYNITLDAPNLLQEFTPQEINQRENAIKQYLLAIATREKDINDYRNAFLFSETMIVKLEKCFFIPADLPLALGMKRFSVIPFPTYASFTIKLSISN